MVLRLVCSNRQRPEVRTILVVASSFGHFGPDEEFFDGLEIASHIRMPAVVLRNAGIVVIVCLSHGVSRIVGQRQQRRVVVSDQIVPLSWNYIAGERTAGVNARSRRKHGSRRIVDRLQRAICIESLREVSLALQHGRQGSKQAPWLPVTSPVVAEKSVQTLLFPERSRKIAAVLVPSALGYRSSSQVREKSVGV